MPLLSALLLSLFLAFNRVPPVQAQSTPNADPKTEIITVSATVADNIAPTTPILISPEDNSYVTTGYVTFVWKGSTDANGIKEYELLVDGSVLFTDIPPNDAVKPGYTVDYDESTEYYTLTVKDLISDGTHTWKIIAIDTLENGSDSATWSFTVDTQAPSFVLTQIGDVPTSISAQDLSTVPEDPIELDENSPQLLGNGEANSTVVLTVTIPDDPTQTFIATTDVNGNWGQLLGILPRDEIIVFDFTITDQAGLVSVLNNVKIIIKTKVITYPPTSPSPTPTPSPDPSASPGVTPVPTPPPPTSPPPSPLISIPLTPPIEIAHEILQETIEHLPAPLKALVAAVPPGVRTYLTSTAINLSPISALLLLLLLALLALLAMLRRFGGRLSPHLIWRSLQALRLFPSGRPQGLVYDSQTHEPIPFALVEVRDENEEVIDSVATDINGIYRGLVLQPGKYEIVVSHPGFRFPTNQARPKYLTVHEFYRNEKFDISDKYEAKNQMMYLIPIDIVKATRQPLYNFSLLNSALFLPLFVITGILTLIFPTFWNWLVFGSYILQVIYKASYWFKTPNLTGNTIDTNGKPLENTIVAVVDSELHQFAALTQSQSDGAYSAFIPAAQLLLAITKPGFIWTENGSNVTQYSIDTSKEKKHVIAALKAVGK